MPTPLDCAAVIGRARHIVRVVAHPEFSLRRFLAHRILLSDAAGIRRRGSLNFGVPSTICPLLALRRAIDGILALRLPAPLFDWLFANGTGSAFTLPIHDAIPTVSALSVDTLIATR
jgi:hypothetical protein